MGREGLTHPIQNIGTKAIRWVQTKQKEVILQTKDSFMQILAKDIVNTRKLCEFSGWHEKYVNKRSIVFYQTEVKLRKYPEQK